MKETPEGQFRSLFDHSLDGGMLVSLDGAIIYANHEVCQMLGMTEDEIRLAGRQGIVVQDGKLEAASEERRRTGRFKGELLFRRKDGTEFPVETSCSVFQERNGQKLVAVMARDITERKHIEQKLASSEIKYRRIFESLDDVYYQTDNKGRIRMLSPSLKRIAGWEPTELIGRPVTDVYVEPGDRKLLLSILAKEKHVRDYDVALKKKDGTPIYTSLSCQLLFDDNGQPDGICGILKDITERS